MIGNIIEYVHAYGYFDFEALPFSGVDALVLAQFVYLKLENIVDGISEGAKAISLREIQAHEKVESLFTDPRWEENNRALFKEMCESKRFGDMKCIYCADHFCRESETQFMALTCIFPDGSVKVLYRGTDESIIGWKEDFNMAFQYPIPGQYFSQVYLEQIAKYISGNFDLIGHSKGGNLSVYAAMHVSQAVQDRIEKIYNLDGPGFRTETYNKLNFEKIADRMIKIIPRSSIIGMLLEDHCGYQVVDSKSVGLLQHDPFSWMIDRIDFVYVKHVDETQKIMDDSLNEWIMSLSKEEMAEFVNTLNQIVAASEATDLISLTKNWTKSLAGMAGAIQNLDEQTKSNIHHVIKSLANASKVKFKEGTENFLQTKMVELNKLISKENSK